MDHILGQDKAIGQLLAQLASGRVHHAAIFHGPQGVGKFTTALAYARLLLCHQPATTLAGLPEACGTCKSCRLLPPPGSTPGSSSSRDGGQASPDAGASFLTAQQPDASAPPADEPASDAMDAGLLAMSSAHPDLHVITKELARFSSDAQVRSRKLTQIPVQVIDEALIGPVQQAPQLGHRKVFILDEAELLNATGQNRLLKTLEEPPGAPGSTAIILVTSSEDRLLPTIRSRCMRIGFLPVEDRHIRQWLEQQIRAAGETADEKLPGLPGGPGAGLPGVDWMVRFAEGSFGRAKLAWEYGLSAWASQVLPAIDGLAKRRLDGELGGRMTSLINTFASDWVDRHDQQAKQFAQLVDASDASGKLTSKEAANKVAADLMWSMLASHARQRAREAAADCTPGDLPASEARLEPWLGVIDATEHARQLAASNVNMSLVCDHLVLQMTRSLARAR